MMKPLLAFLIMLFVLAGATTATNNKNSMAPVFGFALIGLIVLFVWGLSLI